MTRTDEAASGQAPDKHSSPTPVRVPVAPGETWNGQDLKLASVAAAAWLSRHAESINAINVFPVPDGDTGTNMALTMQSAINNVKNSPSQSASEIAAGMSHGALMGARGNSGVILSQILRGFADGISGKETISAVDFAEGLVAATATAYRAVLKPVEGTMLTVVREMSEAAHTAASIQNSYRFVLTETAEAARVSTDRTPLLNEKLRDAGVVDSGGQGVYILVDGIRRYADGEDIDTLSVEQEEKPASVPAVTEGVHVEHGEYGYCTNFLVSGGKWDFDEVRGKIAAMGESAVIVGDDRLVKVHIHTEKPGEVLNLACALGSLSQISIANMQEQHEDFLQMHGDGERSTDGSQTAQEEAGAGTGRIAVLAVVSGSGLVNAFKSMGATRIIEGGQTMNPSTEQLLKAIESVPQEEVILLPNNGNIIMAARQTADLTKKRVVVVPTDTIPRGVAALFALNTEASLDENAQAMSSAADAVETGEITRAVRDAKVSGIDVKNGDIIGLLNNVLVTTGSERDDVAWDLLERMGAGERELITVYWGNDITESDAAAFRDRVADRYPGAEVELVNGGQPFYDYIISAE